MKKYTPGPNVIDQAYNPGPQGKSGKKSSSKSGGSKSVFGSISNKTSEYATNTKDFFLGSRTRKVVTGLGLVAWSLVSYEKPLHLEYVPSPTETIDMALRATGSAITFVIDDTLLGGSAEKSTSPETPTTVAQTGETIIVNETTTEAPATTVDGNLTPETSSVASTSTLAVTPTTLGLESLLPNPIQYSAAAGSVVCSGEVVWIVQDSTSGVAPLTQVRDQVFEQTGQVQEWDQGDPVKDNQLYNEISNNGKLLEYPVRANCTGLEN